MSGLGYDAAPLGTRNIPGIHDGNHALLVGEVLGCLMSHNIEAEPIVVHGDYTNRIPRTPPLGRLLRHRGARMKDTAIQAQMRHIWRLETLEKAHAEWLIVERRERYLAALALLI